MFTDLLAELRAAGEGFIIAEQIPTKLAPETMKNTAVKIVHRLTAADDRAVMAGCADLNEAQCRHVNRLPPGQAVLHDPDLGEAVLIAVQPMTELADARQVPPSGGDREFLRRGSGCELCGEPCRWRDAVEEEGWRAELEPLARHLVSVMLSDDGTAGPISPVPDLAAGAGTGARYCALLAAARQAVSARMEERCRVGGLSGLRPEHRLAIERGLVALGPALAALAAGEIQAETWRMASEGLRAQIASAPPREWPGCKHCAVRCRALPIAAALRARLPDLAVLPFADQDAGVRADAFAKQAAKIHGGNGTVAWCAAVQLVGERHWESMAAAFMEKLRDGLGHEN